MFLNSQSERPNTCVFSLEPGEDQPASSLERTNHMCVQPRAWRGPPTCVFSLERTTHMCVQPRAWRGPTTCVFSLEPGEDHPHVCSASSLERTTHMCVQPRAWRGPTTCVFSLEPGEDQPHVCSASSLVIKQQRHGPMNTQLLTTTHTFPLPLTLEGHFIECNLDVKRELLRGVIWWGSSCIPRNPTHPPHLIS